MKGFFFLSLLLTASLLYSQEIYRKIEGNIDKTKRYLFYLHGKIVEDQGGNAFSEQFGIYDYDSIVKKLAQPGIAVISEIRPANTDPQYYASKVCRQIDTLLENGIDPNKITVLGASKGSVIAMFVSTKLRSPEMRYILIGNCNDFVLENLTINLSGHILSIFENSDSLGRSCNKLVGKHSQATSFKEIIIYTGKKHGFLYQPLKEWVEPAITWLLGK